MSVMYIRNEKTGEFEPVPSLVGPQGPPGANGGGAGTVTSVNKVAPDATGNVTLTAADVGALPKDGTAANANQLNGKSADQYALKSELPNVPVKSVNGKTGAVSLSASDVGALSATAQAADSAKLGGKAPEYYLQPRNLLDNSDFANPVNQRGRTAYIGNGYTIDRWALWGDLETETLAIENGYIALNPETGSVVTLTQRFAKGYLDENKTYTLAYADTKGKIHTSNNPVMCFDEFDYVQIVANKWIGVLWAALYEGEYTADTLPPYVPKGYAAELAECLMYYYPYGSLKLLLTHNADGVDRGTFLFPTKMRIIPTLTYEITGEVDAQFTLEETTKQGFSCYANGVKMCVQIVNCIADADL